MSPVCVCKCLIVLCGGGVLWMVIDVYCCIWVCLCVLVCVWVLFVSFVFVLCDRVVWCCVCVFVACVCLMFDVVFCFGKPELFLMADLCF